MPQELTFEKLVKDITDLKTLVGSTFSADHDEKEKEKEAAKKLAQEDKEKEEKKEARKANKKTASLKKAMEMDDDKERDAAIRKAMEEHPTDDKTDPKEATHKSDEDEKKDEEHKAHIASIIEDSRQDYITKILTANKIMNPLHVKEVEERIKTANITELKKEWNILAPAFEGSVPTNTATPKFVPYFANAATQTDNSQLNANSPDSEFSKFSTQELLEELRQ